MLVPEPSSSPAVDDPNPFVRYGARLAGMAMLAGVRRAALVRRFDADVASVDGRGFTVTPLARADALSGALGFSAAGGVWVKDETANVAGSHKARHLGGVLLHLLAVEAVDGVGVRPPLAIASCGNAALAAATLAAAVGWPLTVYVPPHADPEVLGCLADLGATIVACPRRVEDPPGDPCLLRFREAVAAGAVPFTVQGPENGLCLDGGRTIGWEAADQLDVDVQRLYVQVGGGALATAMSAGLADGGASPALHPVQTAGCAPLARAWRRASELGLDVARGRWRECMWPWEDEPRSAASGILDDETYDWLPLVQRTEATAGAPVVVPESLVIEAHRLACATTGVEVSVTGAAGLAGVLADRGGIGDDERVLVVFSGRR